MSDEGEQHNLSTLFTTRGPLPLPLSDPIPLLDPISLPPAAEPDIPPLAMPDIPPPSMPDIPPPAMPDMPPPPRPRKAVPAFVTAPSMLALPEERPTIEKEDEEIPMEGAFATEDEWSDEDENLFVPKHADYVKILDKHRAEWRDTIMQKLGPDIGHPYLGFHSLPARVRAKGVVRLEMRGRQCPGLMPTLTVGLPMEVIPARWFVSKRGKQVLIDNEGRPILARQTSKQRLRTWALQKCAVVLRKQHPSLEDFAIAFGPLGHVPIGYSHPRYIWLPEDKDEEGWARYEYTDVQALQKWYFRAKRLRPRVAKARPNVAQPSPQATELRSAQVVEALEKWNSRAHLSPTEVQEALSDLTEPRPQAPKLRHMDEPLQPRPAQVSGTSRGTWAERKAKRRRIKLKALEDRILRRVMAEMSRVLAEMGRRQRAGRRRSADQMGSP
ncbi:Uu.00g100340.m01.CDS01 [Anthostomella pinea]|uniref:Uu.00g100340.m01.CDS01 n=1 Tax=Anthostomella pinea TaxID=933095 RepID=A0AAI8VCZ8_9PEZI|nr:Uu.00g100340.m01.CDS01 [Anthostomella pinea]